MKPSHEPAHKSGTYQILIVDDDEIFRRTHKRLLSLFHTTDTDTSFSVIDVGTGDEALDILSRGTIDCVLLDYNLGEENGLALSREIIRKHPSTPVIMLTGAGNESLAAEAIKSGASDYLVKGAITLECLERSITNSIERASLLSTIEAQRKELMDVERQRVMTKSLGAACHHLAQPLTVLRMSLAMLKREETSAKGAKLLADACESVEDMSVVIGKLRHITDYRTETYVNGADSSIGVDDNEILSIEEDEYENHAAG